MSWLGSEVMPWATSGECVLRGPHKGWTFRVDKSQSLAASLDSQQKPTQLCSGGKPSSAGLGRERDSKEHTAELPRWCLLFNRSWKTLSCEATNIILSYSISYIPKLQGNSPPISTKNWKVVLGLHRKMLLVQSRNPNMMEALTML